MPSTTPVTRSRRKAIYHIRNWAAYDRALAWGYVNEAKPDQMPSVAQLKQALIEHGPLAMPIHGEPRHRRIIA